MSLDEIINKYNSDEYLSNKALLQMQRHLIGLQYYYTDISIESFKEWNTIVYLSNKSNAAAKVEADEKHPELRESRKLLEVIKSTLISIQYQLKNE